MNCLVNILSCVRTRVRLYQGFLMYFSSKSLYIISIILNRVGDWKCPNLVRYIVGSVWSSEILIFKWEGYSLNVLTVANSWYCYSYKLFVLYKNCRTKWLLEGCLCAVSTFSGLSQTSTFLGLPPCCNVDSVCLVPKNPTRSMFPPRQGRRLQLAHVRDMDRGGVVWVRSYFLDPESASVMTSSGHITGWLDVHVPSSSKQDLTLHTCPISSSYDFYWRNYNLI